ncbi:MAG: gamma-glutamyltransferase [Gallionellaceae bacterium]|jgi:gamma-glutamyltranspeptidase/glutathione hydrolase|nr:gamma-glutamyltransferase [Gallionellaceae bacterium]
MKFILTVLFAACLIFSPLAQAAATGEHGMVVTAQHLATQTGVDVLKRGGNAVDAAVAVGYALAVTYPAAGNLGGGGFMTIVLADGRKTFIDFREKAPLAATARMYLDADGNVIKGASTLGHLAVAVPGTVAGLETAREKYGTMRRAELIAPAIRHAREGFILDAGDVRMFNYASVALSKDPASAAIFLNHGEAFRAGDKLVQKDLADTLQRISRHGVDGFYKGSVAAALVASSQAGGGILTQADLDQYAVREFAPIECNYRGHEIISAPPPSSGGVTLCEMLNVLEGYPLRDWGYRSARAVQVQIETMRHAYADRNRYLGDPDFVNNPLDRLLSKDYAAEVRAQIAPDKAGVSADMGTPAQEGSNTTHYSIIDQWGNAVSVTYTLNGWFGAKVTAGGTGVLLNNEMDDFTAKPGVPNQFGLVQDEPNEIAPGKRPLSSMSPTVVMKNGKPMLILGTPGGSRIITMTLLTMLNVIDYGMDIQSAVDAPRFHQQWLPEATGLEPDAISADVRATLEGYGQQFTERQPSGHMAVILVEEGRYPGANDERNGTGLALGY